LSIFSTVNFFNGLLTNNSSVLDYGQSNHTVLFLIQIWHLLTKELRLSIIYTNYELI
jgi:hypothetical protein